MIDTTFMEVALIIFTAILGMIAIGAGMIGFWYRKLPWFERFAAFFTGLFLIYPGVTSDIIGFSAFAIMLALQFVFKGSKGGKKETQNATE